ncbi:RraA family protein [Kutzneria buriramensis]|uniref:Putative 4-hydroxy-4-methyl-2-oxoglutarate aldolase n=1 Tax=Kutzneria buriramensis TaxID=1045776 RepID=A0A3E0GYT1_9PSEU|nr:RraA family protein [Kutzneria buriramensis]REH35279.1 regulator of RNase E activity RraA [Kutzneria buriramensis]
MDLRQRFETLTTAHVADACVRAELPVRCLGLRSVGDGDKVVGRVLPARHAGSVDVFLEAYESAEPGDVLVVDNGGQLDHACVGDLIVQEAQTAGLAGVVIWGLHRDTADVRAIGLPVFSLGSLPTGPLRVEERPADALASARMGEWVVDPTDLVLGDHDGVVFIPAAHAEDLFQLAEGIRDKERRQAERIRGGRSLRSQVGFDGFLAQRAENPTLTFREHLRRVGGVVEE